MTERMAIWDWIHKVKPHWHLKNKDYWRFMYGLANEECLPCFKNVATKSVRITPAQELRRIRWECHRKLNPKRNTYGARIDGYLLLRINEISRDDDNVDNLRFAEASNRADMHRYRKLKESGCCGANDFEVIIETWYGFGKPRSFWVGYNYGH